MNYLFVFENFKPGCGSGLYAYCMQQTERDVHRFDNDKDESNL
jgi:hypothetical protein